MTEQKIEPGQLWRRRKGGRLFRIVAPFSNSSKDDWRWEGVGYPGSGESYGVHIRRNSELVEEATQ